MARGKPHRRTAPLGARGTSGVEPGPSLYRPISITKVPSEAGRQRLNRQLYRSSKHHSPASNPLGGSETAGCGRRRPAQPASIRDVRDITEAAPLARHGTTTSVAPQTTLARFSFIPGQLSGSAGYFCRADSGSFARALQVLAGLALPIWHWKDADQQIGHVLDNYDLSGSELHTAWMARRYLEQSPIPNFRPPGCGMAMPHVSSKGMPG